jgi:Tfp pilus assembly protein PilN
MAVLTQSINLVKNRKPHVLDQFISWAVTIGRALVIVVELVALGAFLYRFGLDRQLVDLHDKIKQEQNIVSFLKKNEDTYRNLQTRLELANNILINQTQITKTFQDILNLLPQDMILKTVTFSPSSMKIDATAQSVNSLSNFISNLKNYPTVSSVSIDKIETKTASAIINLTLTIQFKKNSTQIL